MIFCKATYSPSSLLTKIKQIGIICHFVNTQIDVFRQQQEIEIYCMSKWFPDQHYHPIMYAENCPQQPVILKETTTIQQEPSIHQIAKKAEPKQIRSNIIYRPRIITTKKWGLHSTKGFQEIQHERQLSILQKRIKDCKSLTQRKKDHNDPIIYPSYFIRQKKRSKDARIDAYYRRIVENANNIKPQIQKQPKKTLAKQQSKNKIYVQEQEQNDYINWPVYKNNNFTRSNFPLPPVTRQQVRRDKQSLLNLPQSNTKSIVNYINERRMFLEADLKILKARLFHYYGKTIERYWREALNYILKHKPT